MAHVEKLFFGGRPRLFKQPDKSEFSDAIASASERNSEPRKGRYMVARGEAPLGARTPGIGHKNKREPRQGWHNAWREIPHCFKMPQTQTKHAPTTARSFASLRSSPSYAALVAFADAQAARAQISFLLFPGVPRLRRSTPGYLITPLPGLQIRRAFARNYYLPAKLRFIAQLKKITANTIVRLDPNIPSTKKLRVV